jgi:hypothetical protein
MKVLGQIADKVRTGSPRTSFSIRGQSRTRTSADTGRRESGKTDNAVTRAFALQSLTPRGRASRSPKSVRVPSAISGPAFFDFAPAVERLIAVHDPSTSTLPADPSTVGQSAC